MITSAFKTTVQNAKLQRSPEFHDSLPRRGSQRVLPIASNAHTEVGKKAAWRPPADTPPSWALSRIGSPSGRVTKSSSLSVCYA